MGVCGYVENEKERKWFYWGLNLFNKAQKNLHVGYIEGMYDTYDTYDTYENVLECFCLDS